jgi:hypothetical protein
MKRIIGKTLIDAGLVLFGMGIGFIVFGLISRIMA